MDKKIAQHYSKILFGDNKINKNLTESNRDFAFEVDSSISKTIIENSLAGLELLDADGQFDNRDLVNKVKFDLENEGRKIINAVTNNENGFLLSDRKNTDLLEIIVRTDGSRPSFMIQNGAVNLESSPVGEWGNTVTGGGPCLAKAIRAAGRVNFPGDYHQGSGFLITSDLFVTNRHVLQIIGTETSPGKWKISTGANVNFGHEFRGINDLDRREILGVVFCAAKPIFAPVDHTKLDLVILKLSPSSSSGFSDYLSIGTGKEWNSEGTYIFTIGYPGQPSPGEILANPGIYSQLFKNTYGCKRLSPGMIIYPNTTPAWTVSHDGSTEGGSSGSLIIAIDNGCIAAGLHYGGTLKTPKRNWGHDISETLDTLNTIKSGSLKQCLDENGVKLIDQFA